MSPTRPLSVCSAPSIGMTRARSRWVRIVWTGLGAFFLAVGVIGIFVPLLPTTCFVLLAAACAARGSEQFHNWLLDHRVFGPWIRDFHERRGISARTKLMAISLLVVTLGISIVLLVPGMVARLALGAVGICVIVYLLRYPTRR